MAPKDRSNGLKGFASMDEEKKKGFARQGGIASAMTRNTSNRGFASMDKAKLKQISSMGGKASSSARAEGNEKDAEQKDIREKSASDEDLISRNDPEERETEEPLAYSETDEDEDEGLGDGNLGRSARGDTFGD